MSFLVTVDLTRTRVEVRREVTRRRRRRRRSTNRGLALGRSLRPTKNLSNGTLSSEGKGKLDQEEGEGPFDPDKEGLTEGSLFEDEKAGPVGTMGPPNKEDLVFLALERISATNELEARFRIRAFETRGGEGGWFRRSDKVAVRPEAEQPEEWFDGGFDDTSSEGT